ncbi:probable LRR receptor-like serine/threonine-protein kinase At1g53430 isoform X2 [Cryptomeria japonica]|uniref:probable LRR receptor-like serine/threonine-protein kinase At1g53430 isoform X2 n=1 Tax=Cryptomeria japonica TaxID=3369 RepID=UPI0027DA581E|nr:probable LRR receptor-like serine/threonine-protein kinase At1g53430 isoform X2 [Cryptomeria japonica]
MAIHSRLGFIFLVWVLHISLLHCYYRGHPGEAAAATVTDPQEVKALKTIRDKMRNRKWDFSEDPCSGKGSWNVSQEYETQNNLFCEMHTTEGRTFFHVTRIYLKSQNLTGVVPAELANLTYLEEIDFSCNHLNGPIPPELGSLANLRNLDLYSNELSGLLPQSFVKLDNLEMLYIQSNQLHGKIPKIYGYFHRLKNFVASSNNFRGKIPDFIGNWKSLTILRLEATSLEGPIPSTFSNLIQLEDLRISYLTGDGSNLSFIQNLTKLRTIVLRNAMLYGEIPKYIGDSIKPKILDLSFNNLTGSIPKALENTANKHQKIEYLYLGNNNLMGKLQEWLSTINNVDLSYNYFSGELITNTRQVNLIQNSFDSNVSNGRDQAYFQRGFTCRDPQYTSLDINCGGIPWTTYEGDVNPLGPSSYFSSSNGNWAVSNTGLFMDAEHHKWIVAGNNSQFAKGINTEVYGTARCSSSSLRYYALCLQNGEYNVQLHFAEIVISNGMIFPSLGRRIFDVYIQGSRRLKDFNIKDAAGGSSYKKVIRNFSVTVTENFLEIHFFWAGKGTYDIPVRGTYGPLVSAIKISPNFKINNTTISNGRNKSNTSMIVGIVSGAVIALGFTVCLSFIFIRRRNRMKSRSSEGNDDTEFLNMDTISNTFSLEMIKNATSDFNPENKIGEGGFGTVFKGILPDGKMIAVKQMFHNSRQGVREFLNELGTISAMHHPNLVELYGCCIEGKELFLVYEYMENNSLARVLFGPQGFRLNLKWPQRYNICLGVARGLAYLHEGSRLKIIHRDIKTTNILLDQDLNPKISDFGLAKLFDQGKTHVNTRVAGTIGYMAPEYALKGHLTEKADVYSFGVVVLEAVSGRTHTEKTMQAEMVYLLEWTWHLYEKKRLLDLVDVNLKKSSYSKEEVLRVINVGLLCTNGTPMERPSMSTVVEMLEGKIEAHVSHSRPSYQENWQPNIYTEEKPSSRRESLSFGGPSHDSSSA